MIMSARGEGVFDGFVHSNPFRCVWMRGGSAPGSPLQRGILRSRAASRLRPSRSPAGGEPPQTPCSDVNSKNTSYITYGMPKQASAAANSTLPEHAHRHLAFFRCIRSGFQRDKPTIGSSITHKSLVIAELLRV
jgi:hypothetical protein